MVTDGIGFWQGNLGKLVRWIVFLPVGYLLWMFLSVAPVLAVAYAKNYRPEFNFLTIVLAVIVVSVLGTVAWFWAVAVFLTPHLSCGVVAPNPRVATVIFATIFCLGQAMLLLNLAMSGWSWVMFFYFLAFSGIMIGGLVSTYRGQSGT